MEVIGGKTIKIIIMKQIVIIIIAVMFHSCMDVWFIADRAIPVKINCKDTLLLGMECGEIELSTSYIQNNSNSQNINIYVRQYFKSCDCVLNKDLLLFDLDDKIKVNDIQLFHRKKNDDSRQTKKIEENTYQINSEEIVFLCINATVSENWNYVLKIQPNNYILCNDKPLLTDTIKIRLK
jgi:hypothetical protein